VSEYVLDASYALTWCFRDRATTQTDESLRRMESRADTAVVPSVWSLEIGNVLGKFVVREKIPLERALEIWNELLLLPIQRYSSQDVPSLMRLAVRHNMPIYDAAYLQLAVATQRPLATNDHALATIARTSGVEVITP